MRTLLRWLREPEIIGPPDCPIMLRWSIIGSSQPTVNKGTEGASQGRTRTLIVLPKWLTRDRKLLLHRFLPNVEDRDPHDHPRGFWTLVLWGRYLDLVLCGRCSGAGAEKVPIPMKGRPDISAPGYDCPACDGDGVVIGDVMKPGTLRYRPAEHTHITQSGPKGAWTLVLMTPLERPWGFWRGGGWWPWRDYEKKFGFAMRCPTEDEQEGVMLKYSDAMAEPKGGGDMVLKTAPVGLSTDRALAGLRDEADAETDPLL